MLRRRFDPRLPSAEDNDRTGARRNIARHYDLSNELFATFLDESMSYSSALFEDPTSLREAQARKIERLLDATNVGEGSRVLEVGTGWGELALRAARRGAQVTSVTLSTEQAHLARERVRDAGLDDRVDIRVEDYRDVEGDYDAIVSVEMIEAVGERWWPTYFRTLDQRLAPGGRVGLQCILMSHDQLEATKSSWTWIHKYIFPGGSFPPRGRFATCSPATPPWRLSMNRTSLTVTPRLFERGETDSCSRRLTSRVSALTRRSVGCGSSTSPTAKRGFAVGTSTWPSSS